MYGDLLVTKIISQEQPYKIGEENVLLGIANTCSVVTRSFVPLLQIEQADFFKLLSDANYQVI